MKTKNQNIYSEVVAKLGNSLGEIPQINNQDLHSATAKLVPAIRMMLSETQLRSLKVIKHSLLNQFLVSSEKFAQLTGHAQLGLKSLWFAFEDDELALLSEIREALTKNPQVQVIGVREIGIIIAGECAQHNDALELVLKASCTINLAAANDRAIIDTLGIDEASWIEAAKYSPVTSDKLKRVECKIAVVTGGAQGFGAGIVENLMENGANVVIADLNEEKGREFAESLNSVAKNNKAWFVKADVSNAASVENLVLQTVCEFGGLDVFISNAGILRAGGLDEMSPETFELMTKVNYSAYFLCAKYASAVMKLQNKFKAGYFTDIIQINSKSGLKGSNRNFAYAGGKFGGIGLTQSFALELMPSRIKVNSVCPGNFFDGPLWSDPENGLFVQYLRAGKVPGAKTIDDVKRFYEAQVPAGRGCTPLDVMRAVYYIIEQEYETGQAVPVTGGQNMLN